MKRGLALLATAGTIAISGSVLACGACVEDKVAATYDHSVVRAAIDAQREVIFVALDGCGAVRIGDRLVAAAATAPGVPRGSLRYAASPPAFSFALDRGAVPEKAMAAFRKAVAGADVRMTIVRVMRRGALVDPPT